MPDTSARAAAAGRTKEAAPIDDGEVVVDEPGEPRAAAG
jgi:hypothetical protein